MIAINAKPYHERLTDAYYQKVLNENKAYLDKHGKGPYEYKGRFTFRIEPYLDAGYWHQYDKWLKSEFKISHSSGFNEYYFESEEDVTWFLLRCS